MTTKTKNSIGGKTLEDIIIDRWYERRKFWMDVYTAKMSAGDLCHPDVAASFADSAVRHYDSRYPKPKSKDKLNEDLLN